MSALFQRSLTGGLLIAVILLLRKLLQDRLPKGTFRVLWIIALFHLLLPKLPTSPLSLYNLGVGMAQPLRAPEVIGTGTAVQGLPIEQGIFNALAMQNTGARGEILFPIWLIGMVLCAGWFLIGYVRCLRRYRSAEPPEGQSRKGIRLRQSSMVNTPLAYGLLCPTILLPAGFEQMDAETAQWVLLHEELHIRRGDLWLKAGVAAAVSIYWFAPWVWLMLHLVERDIELACDAAVLHRMGAAQRRSYAMALIRMEEQKPQRPALVSGFAGNALEARIIAIMKNKKTTKAALAAAILLCLCVSMVLAAAARPVEGASIAKPTAAPAPEKIVQETEPQAEVPVEEKSPYAEETYEQTHWIWPVPSSNHITGRFGTRTHPITGEKMVYDHITVAASKDILAAQSGKVMDVFFDSYSGNTVVIEHMGYVTMYGHLAEVHVRVGQYVEGGAVIGTAGRTGMATGDCLAFWVSRNGTTVDPLQFYNIDAPKFVEGAEISKD